MRRFHALLIAAGLAAMPASAAAGPTNDLWSPAQVLEKYEHSTRRGRLGVMVISLTPELRTHFGSTEDRGVLVAHVEPNTPAAAAGIAVGDVIANVRGRAIGGAVDVLTALADVTRGQAVAVEIVRNKKSVTVKAKLVNDPAQQTKPPWSSMPKWLRDMTKPFAAPEETEPNESSLRS